MNENDLLTMLKADLEIIPQNTTRDDYLLQLLASAQQFISREGVTLGNTAEDVQLVVMYAAWLYRRRAQDAEATAAMPRMLRWALNNRIFSVKMQGGADDAV